MGLAILIIGLVVFLGAHVFVTRREARAALIARIGENPLQGGVRAGLARRPRADRLGLRAIPDRSHR